MGHWRGGASCLLFRSPGPAPLPRGILSLLPGPRREQAYPRCPPRPRGGRDEGGARGVPTPSSPRGSHTRHPRGVHCLSLSLSLQSRTTELRTNWLIPTSSPLELNTWDVPVIVPPGAFKSLAPPLVLKGVPEVMVTFVVKLNL